ncbi:hypothetical protein [Humibacter ginsengisoli]
MKDAPGTRSLKPDSAIHASENSAARPKTTTRGCAYIIAASTAAAIPALILFFFQRQIPESIKTSGFK